MMSVRQFAPACPAGRSSPVRQLKIKDYLFCVLSAVLLIFSFPNYNLWILAWFGFVPLLFALKNKSKGRAFLLAYLTGLIFWSGIIYWLIHVTLPGLIILVFYLALYFGVFGILILSMDYGLSTIDLLFIPSAWVLLEYVRGHLFTGFPWALLGYSQYQNLPIIQIADITGSWGVSFLVMMVNVFIYLVVSRKLSVVSNKKQCLLPILCILLAITYGFYKLHHLPFTIYHLPLRISVIQPNISQELKWDPNAKPYILDKYARLTEKASYENPVLIIWPEAATPGLLGEDKEVFENIFSLSKKINTPLLIGSVVREDEKYFNSAVLINSSGEIVTRYDKLHLVPFGEYIPFKRILPFLETVVPIGDITAGREYTVFQTDSLTSWPVGQLASSNRQTGKPANRQTKFSILICFEDLFPELSREFVKKGAQFLVNITNDAWYKRSSAAQQHFQASVFRAVENRVYLVRSANTGVSGFIAPNGKIVSLVKDKSGKNIFISGYNTQEIYIAKNSFSFYTRYGDFFVAFCFLAVLYGIILSFKKK